LGDKNSALGRALPYFTSTRRVTLVFYFVGFFDSQYHQNRLFGRFTKKFKKSIDLLPQFAYIINIADVEAKSL